MHAPVSTACYTVSTDANLVYSVQESARRPSCKCGFCLVIVAIVTVFLAVRIMGSLDDAERDQATYAAGPPPPQ